MKKYRLYRLLLDMVAVWPLKMLYPLSDTVAFILHRVAKYRVPVVRKNLAMAFPEKSEAELKQIEDEFYRHFCDIFVETAKLSRMSERELDRRIRIEGVEHINSALAQGRSVVLLMGHYGNWEWVTALARRISPGAVMAEIYHKLNNKDFNRLMVELRSRFGTENIPMAKTVRRLIEINREGRQFVCGFISDQRPFTPELKHWTDFLGIDTAYVNGGEVIGQKLGTEFLYVECRPVKRGHYVIEVSPLEPLNDSEENPYTRAYLARLEQSIRRNPSYWLWSHNRWKRKREVKQLSGK